MNFDANSEVDLSRFETLFQATKSVAKTEIKRESAPVPDGIYRVAIEDMNLGVSTTSGNPQVKWSLRILGPGQQRRMLYKRNTISERSLSYLVEELERCGVVLGRFSDLEKYLPGMIGLEIEIAKKTKGDMTNIYINKLLGPPPVFDTVDADLPF